MSAYCNYDAQHCKDNCCDRQGVCPEVSGYVCYYTYGTASGSGFTGGAIAGAIIGGIFVVVAVIVVILWCCCRQQPNKENDEPTNGVNYGVPIPLEQPTVSVVGSLNEPHCESMPQL